MASEVFEILMRIGVTGDILDTLRNISGGMSEIHGKVGEVGGAFATLGGTMREAGRLGIVAFGLSGAIMAGLDAITKKGDEVERTFNKIKAVYPGLSSQEMFETARRVAAEVPGSLITENAKLLTDLTMIMGNEKIAERMLVPMTQAAEILQKYGGHEEIAPLLRLFSREHISPEAMIQRITTAANVVRETGGAVSMQDWTNMYRASGEAGIAWSANFRENVLPKLMTEWGKGGGRMNLGMQFLQEFGKELTDKKDKIGSLMGRGISFGAIENDPYAIAQALARGLKERGLDPTKREDVDRMLAEAGFNARQMGPLSEMIMQGREARGGASMFEQRFPTQSLEQMEKFWQSDPMHVREAMFASVTNFITTLGHALTGSGWEASHLHSITDFFNHWSDVIAKVPAETIRQYADGLLHVAEGLMAIGAALMSAGLLSLAANPSTGVALGLLSVSYALGKLYEENKNRDWSTFSKSMTNLWEIANQEDPQMKAFAQKINATIWAQIDKVFSAEFWKDLPSLSTMVQNVMAQIRGMIYDIGAAFQNMVSKLTFGMVPKASATDRQGFVHPELLSPFPQRFGDWSSAGKPSYLPPGASFGGSMMPLPSSVPLPFTNFGAGAPSGRSGSPSFDMMFGPRTQLSPGGGGFGGASISEAAIAPPQDRVKPVTIATNLNIDGRLLAQQISDHLIAMMEMSSGAGAADGRSLLHMPDAGMTTT